MGYIIAGLAIAAAGAGTSAYGTSQNAEAQADAAFNNILLENKFAKKWTSAATDLSENLLDKLYDVGNIFDRFESTGAFGDTSTLKNLRQAQEDFSLLGAGDFTRFDTQLRSAINDNLVNTFGSGAPIGTFANLSADTIMNFRRTGVSDAMAIGGYISQEANNLLGMEFGVLNQDFERRFSIDRQRLNVAQGNYAAAASTEGVGTSAWGNALQSIGTSLFTYGMGSQAQSSGANAGNLGGHSMGGQMAYGTTPATNPYIAPYVPTNYGSVVPRTTTSSYVAPITVASQDPSIPPPPPDYTRPTVYGDALYAGLRTGIPGLSSFNNLIGVGGGVVAR